MKKKIMDIWEKQKNKKIIFLSGGLVICIGLALIIGACFSKDDQKLEENTKSNETNKVVKDNSKNSSNDQRIVVDDRPKSSKKDTKEKLGTLKIKDMKLDEVFYAYSDNERTCLSGAICIADWNKDFLKKDKNVTIGSYALGSKSLYEKTSKIKKGSIAYLEYKGTTYKYKYTKKRTIRTPNKNIVVHNSKDKKEYLSLFARKTPMTYDILDFEYVSKK